MLEASAPVTAMLYGGDGGVAGPGWDASPYSNISVIIDEIHFQPRDDHPAAQVSIKWQTHSEQAVVFAFTTQQSPPS